MGCTSCGEGASAAGGPGAGREVDKRPGRARGSGVAVRPRLGGSEPGGEAGTSAVALGERGSPAPPALVSSFCSGTRSSPEGKLEYDQYNGSS